MKPFQLMLFLPLMTILFFSTCIFGGNSNTEDLNIVIKGSITTEALFNKLIEEFTKEHKEIIIKYIPFGSLYGIMAMIDDDVDIAVTTRELDKAESGLLEKSNLIDHYSKKLFARDALVFIVNNNNPLSSIEFEDLRDIFSESGLIKDWIPLTGSKEPIILLLRNKNAGTYRFLQNYLLNEGNFRVDKVEYRLTDNEIMTEIRDDEKLQKMGVISSSLLGTVVTDVKPLVIKGFGDITDEENIVKRENYPFNRDILLYRKKYVPSKDMKESEQKSLETKHEWIDEFLDFVYSEGGKSLTRLYNFYPHSEKGGIDTDPFSLE